MKYKILLLAFFFSIDSFSQDLCKTDIMNGEKLLQTNEVENFSKYDFSELWLQTDNNLVYGILGDDFQRIQIKLISISKNINNQNEYFVYGKSKVKENICEFVGKITILKIQESKREHFGVDDEFKNSGIKTQGLLTAKYEFFENKLQSHSGYFTGSLETKWFLDKDDKIQYDNINIHSDGYFNNAFVGSWKMYHSIIEKKCHWGDYRVPSVECGFDIGAAEFNIAEKYHKKGWLDSIETKKRETIKNWWE
ncbi:hypothetical protein [Flavobacterium bernardetii]|nr:hypothetical protein [Flavobacterium bernardetii]